MWPGSRRGAALADLAHGCGIDVDELKVVERVDRPRNGDETVFERDLVVASAAEQDVTLGILAVARARTLQVIRRAPAAVLDWRDSHRRLPAYASWFTPRELAWHIADTESRYYLPVLGLPAKPRAVDLLTDLAESAAHVRSVVAAMPRDLWTDAERDGVWTSTKVLRRLAWHERGELVVLEQLIARHGGRGL